MFDYKLLAALAAVVEQAGFERAAQVLGLSQSAVSQRVKLLEARVGQPVLVRTLPPTATEIGKRLLNHVQQVRLLERDVQALVPALDESALPERLRIAINADSLATWWGAAVGEFCRRHGLLLDLLIEDQAVGLKRMQAGEVAACVCANERPVAGARALPLGVMRYRALASPDFVAQHFAQGFSAQALAQAPAIVFGPDDQLQHRYLSAMGVSGGFAHHLCPSSEGFMCLALAGLGWGLIPEIQVQAELQRGELIELEQCGPFDVALYWHHWRNGGQLLQALTEHLQHSAPQLLLPQA